MPFFSVVIPTRNRPALLANAVASVLEQEFPDLELIVSDNSDVVQAKNNYEYLNDTFGDKRLRYVRPQSVLSMTEHWDWAIRHSRGLYTGILTDRCVYRLYALKMLHLHFESGSNRIVSFLSDSIVGDAPPFRMKIRPAERNSRATRADELLRDFSNSKFPKQSPRMLNTFCSTDLLQELVRRYGSVFTGFAPDYSFCFRVLDAVEEFLSLDAALVISTYDSQSNGIAFRKNQANDAQKEFLLDMEQRPQWFKYGPISGHEGIIPNAILREYEIARECQISGRLPPVNYHAFYVAAHSQLEKLAAQGFDQTETLNALEEFRVKHHYRKEALAGVLIHRLRAKVRKWRRSIREQVLRALGHAAFSVRRTQADRLVISFGQWHFFDTILSALRYDAKFNSCFRKRPPKPRLARQITD